MLLVQLDKDFPEAQAPTRGSIGCAGYDLYACVSLDVQPLQWAVVDIGIRVVIPEDCYGRIAPRSSLTIHHGIMIGAGVIDSDYRGLVKVVLFNAGQDVFRVESGNRIAQMILEQVKILPVKVVETITTTTRGEGGFGSTGSR
ncbi:dUTP diphosphatase [Meira miltonrushii]|uniref:Deoxyuridine 5'-triphosphate nucleotidohydrolase n=1 Tax=Meira miltonrushii TaxID=1280837 RepID=A0A316VK46_9BASI|nr:dUTP diphosphatase [Meira miltonrushii]PWN37979.1 dUTP diphosphatase [Meira miltonrushii]